MMAVSFIIALIVLCLLADVQSYLCHLCRITRLHDVLLNNIERRPRPRSRDVALMGHIESLTVNRLGKLAETYCLYDTNAKAHFGQSRSEVIDCFDRRNSIPLKAKITKDLERFRKEKENYQKIGKSASTNFVRIDEFVERSTGTSHIMIMEAGAIDVKSAGYKIGPLRGKRLLDCAYAMASAVNVIHQRGMVWTDLKLDNFVLVPKRVVSVNFSTTDGTAPLTTSRNSNQQQQKAIVVPPIDYFGSGYVCKGIDLESVVPVNQPIRDFSPEVAAPEQVEVLLGGGELSTQGGRTNDFKLATQEPILGRKETDIWALGICILQLYLGKAPIVDRPIVQQCIKKVSDYVDGIDDLGLSQVQSASLRKLLASMLNVKPSKRPGILSVMLQLKFCSA